jgi:AP-1 complex subunit gamma-1
MYMSRQGDLLGDDISATPSTGPNMAQPATAQSNQDLLAEIFRSLSNESTGTTTATPSQQQKSTVDDILSLFGSSSSPTPVPSSAAPGPPAASFAQGSLPFPSTLAVSTPCSTAPTETHDLSGL